MVTLLTILLQLSQRLFPTGRAFRTPKDGVKDAVITALAQSEEDAINDLKGTLDTVLADNNNFTAEDAAVWERRLAIRADANTPLEDRKAAIRRKYASPGNIPARQHFLYLQGQLQDAGFNVFVHENKLPGVGAWTNADYEAGGCFDTVYDDGVWIGVGSSSNIQRSTDNGVNWSTITPPAGLSLLNAVDVNPNTGVFIAAHDGGASSSVIRSVDGGLTWSEITTNLDTAEWQDIKYCDHLDRWVVVGRQTTTRVAYSDDDGLTWTRVAAATDDDWESLTCGDGVGNNGFVAVSNQANKTAMRSADGITWVSSSTIFSNGMESVVFGKDRYVAVGGSQAFVSTDGGDVWVAGTIEAISWEAIGYGELSNGAGIFVAIADTGTNRISTSLNGFDWVGEPPPNNIAWRGMSFGNNRFLATANSGGPLNRVAYADITPEPRAPGDIVTLGPLTVGDDDAFVGPILILGSSEFGTIANRVDPNEDAGFVISSDLRATFFIGGPEIGDFAEIPAIREPEFRELVLNIKPAQTVAFLFINYN